MEKILILEDNHQLLELMSSILRAEKQQVFKVNSIKRAKNLISKKAFDLLILDRILPDGDVLDLLEEIREKDQFLRILMLSRKSMLADRLKSLSLADDFLAKPFNTQEFLLKVENLLKREKKTNKNVLKLSDDNYFSYGESSGPIMTALREKERLILECLLEHSNSIVSYERLTSYVWGFTEIRPNKKTINVYIRRIRMKIAEHAANLKTVRGQGYIYLSELKD
jgi:two-component system OmpR family response regulator